MAITTLSGALAGMQIPQFIAKASTGTPVAGRPQSTWVLGGLPGSGTPNATLNGATYSSSSGLIAGQIPHYDPGSGNSYLARLQLASVIPGMALLCDRIWDNQLTINSTGAQSITTPTWPSRDTNGATAGAGILLAVEVSAITSATAAVISVTYTNQGATGSRTATFLDVPTAITGTAGAFYRLALQAGDTGVQSVQSATFSTAWTSGTVGLVAYRVLATIELSLANISNAVDALTGGFPQFYNGTVPWLVHIPNSATAFQLFGQYIETQG